MAFPRTINGRLWLRDHIEGSDGYAYAEPPDFFDLIEDVLDEVPQAMSGSTGGSLAVSAGVKTFAIQDGKGFKPGHPVRIALQADPSTVYMDGVVLAYDLATGDVSVEVTSLGPTLSGTFAGWNVILTAGTGAPDLGEIALPLSIGQGGTGATSRSGARAALEAPHLFSSNTFVGTMRVQGESYATVRFNAPDHGVTGGNLYFFDQDASNRDIWRWSAADGTGRLLAYARAGGVAGATYGAKLVLTAAGEMFAGPTANNRVWHSGNDGAGSGLDADTLRGQTDTAIRNALVPPGAIMLFHQDEAPPGWAKIRDQANWHDRVLIVTTGNKGNGGIHDATWVFSRTQVDGHALNWNEMPAHTHGNDAHVHNFFSSATAGTGTQALPSFGGADAGVWRSGFIDGQTINIHSAGSNWAHTHGCDIRSKWITFIACQRA